MRPQPDSLFSRARASDEERKVEICHVCMSRNGRRISRSRCVVVSTDGMRDVQLVLDLKEARDLEEAC